MGEYAEYQLQSYMRNMRAPVGPPRKRKLVSCPNCGKECRGQGGVMQHQNANHGHLHTWAEICRAPVEYE